MSSPRVFKLKETDSMALKDAKDYEDAKKRLENMSAEYEKLRGMEAAKDAGSETRQKLKDMMQPLNDLRGEVDYYEIKNGLRPAGMFVKTEEIR